VTCPVGDTPAMPLTLDQAQSVVAKAHERAREMGLRITVAVVDEGGFLLALGRMDGAPPLSARVAEGKAAGAAIWHKEGGQLASIQAENPAFVAAVAELARLPLLPGLGSTLIHLGGDVLGAVGASGASGEDDLECVEFGLRAVFASPE
jgi:glc operon protein GlcG